MSSDDTKMTPSASQIASVGRKCPAWHRDFVRMLPKIEDHARFVFRHLKSDRQEEAVQETICNCVVAFARLFKRGRAKAATWSSLARYAVAQVRSGRRVGTSLNIKDLTSSWLLSCLKCERLRNKTEVRLTGRTQEEILHLPMVTEGKDPIHERMLRPIVAEVDWGRQLEMWADIRVN